jgi:hypothetical protein
MAVQQGAHLLFAMLIRRANIPPPSSGQPGLFSLGGPSAPEGEFRKVGF